MILNVAYLPGQTCLKDFIRLRRTMIYYNWLEVEGRHGWKARYVKEVNSMEDMVKFYQEIYDSNGNLAEIHEKFPVDKGHRKIKEE